MSEKSSPIRSVDDWRWQLEELVDASVVERYDGDLERDEELDRKGVWDGWVYTPCDVDHIRELLTTIWDGVLTSEEIESAFERLTKDGRPREGWPHPDCWCEEELEEEERERLDAIDAEEWAREEHENWSARVELNIFSELDEINYRQTITA